MYKSSNLLGDLVNVFKSLFSLCRGVFSLGVQSLQIKSLGLRSLRSVSGGIVLIHNNSDCATLPLCPGTHCSTPHRDPTSSATKTKTSRHVVRTHSYVCLTGAMHAVQYSHFKYSHEYCASLSMAHRRVTISTSWHWVPCSFFKTVTTWLKYYVCKPAF